MTAMIAQSPQDSNGERDTNDSSVLSTSPTTSTPMHRVLAIQELLCHILGVFLLDCSDFQDAKRRGEATSTLAALARTSKLFHEFSLNYLWDTLPSVLPVVLLLSDSISQIDFIIQPRGRVLPRITQRLPTTDADISRLLKYAPRIRRLVKVDQGSPPGPEVYVEDAVFESLSKIKPRGSDYLFSNLRLFHWPVYGVHYTCIDYAFIFVGPNITEVDLRIHPYLDKMDRTLMQFELCRPPIKHLRNQSFALDPFVILPLIHTILKFPSLTSVSLNYPCLKLTEWPTLVQLPYLSSLRICVPMHLAAGPILFESAFPSLKELTLRFLVGRVCFKHFLDHFLENRLAHLTGLILLYNEPTDSIDTILHNLHRVCDPRVLETMKITRWPSDFEESGDDEVDVSADTLDPLFAFPNLRTVCITPMKRMSLDDGTIERMAFAWRKIEHLSIGDLWVSPSKVTLWGLVPLARHCPHLHTLSISIDACGLIPKELPKILQDGHWNSPLHTLHVSKSPIDGGSSFPDKVQIIASFLATIFPLLKEVNYTKDMDDPNSTNGWSQVSSKLQSGEPVETRNFGDVGSYTG